MLSVRALRAGYGERIVFDAVDLDVERGELVAIIGPNGCGKTTLLRTITGVHPATSGVLLLDGEPICSRYASSVDRRVAFVPQRGVTAERFSAFDTALMGRTPHLRLLQSEGRRDLEVTRAAMERADCWELRDRRVDELSGGERQRVLIARALAQEPDLLLLDEPTSHLDIAHQVEAFQLVLSLCREQELAAVAVVHDLTLAGMFADRVALMSGGRIDAVGVPEQVIREDLIERAYGLPVRVVAHPSTGRPIVVPDASPTAAGDSTVSDAVDAWLRRVAAPEANRG